MNFFFEYIYYRITELFFKRQGRTGFAGLTVVSVIQALSIGIIILEISKSILNEERHKYSKDFGMLGAAITLLFMYYNYKKHNGKYNKYRFYWENETRSTRIFKGFLIILTFLFPISLFVIFGVHWKKS